MAAGMARHKAASVDKVRPGEMIGLSIGGRELLVANVGGQFFAIDGRCSRRCGKLWKGRLKGHVVECPNHGATFDVRDGRALSSTESPRTGKAKDLRAYEVIVDDGEVFVTL